MFVVKWKNKNGYREEEDTWASEIDFKTILDDDICKLPSPKVNKEFDLKRKVEYIASTMTISRLKEFIKREKKQFKNDPQHYDIPKGSRKKIYVKAAIHLAEKIGLEKASKILRLNPKAEVKKGTFHKGKGDHRMRASNSLYRSIKLPVKRKI